jgi:hypothetical protein
MQSTPGQVSLRRAAIWAPVLKAIACAALAGYFIWSLTRIYGFGWTLTFVAAVLWLIGGAGYVLAGFLLSRRSLSWRFTGGLIDATATAIVAGVILWIDEPSLTAVYSCCQGDPRVVMPAIVALIAVAWITGSLPMMAWLTRDTAARFHQRRQQT